MDDFTKCWLLLFMIPVSLMLLVGYSLYLDISGVDAEWDCKPYKDQGYETRIVAVAPVGYDCWIKHGDDFVPLDKWLNVNMVGD